MSFKRSYIALATLFSAAAPHIAFAAEAQHDDGGSNLFKGDFGNAFWTLLIFFLVLVVLGKFAWKPILKMLQDRERFISESLSKAKETNASAERMMADYKAKIDKAHQEATAIVDEARRDAEEARKRIQGEAKAESEAIAARAKKDIELARDHAIKDLHDQSIQLATAVAGKLLRRELTPSDHQALLNEAFAELSKRN